MNFCILNAKISPHIIAVHVVVGRRHVRRGGGVQTVYSKYFALLEFQALIHNFKELHR